MAAHGIIIPLLVTAGAAIINRVAGGGNGGGQGNLSPLEIAAGLIDTGSGPFGTPGPPIQIVPGGSGNGTSFNSEARFKIDPCTGQMVEIKKRRRRKRLLTCGDKADIGFVIGQMGKGQLASSTVSSMLARCG